MAGGASRLTWRSRYGAAGDLSLSGLYLEGGGWGSLCVLARSWDWGSNNLIAPMT
jgi:hypothetical protein